MTRLIPNTDRHYPNRPTPLNTPAGPGAVASAQLPPPAAALMSHASAAASAVPAPSSPVPGCGRLRQAAGALLLGMSVTAGGACEGRPGAGRELTWPAEYGLARVGTAAPPAVLESDSLCAVTLFDATLTFTSRNGYRSAYSLRRVCGATSEPLNDPGVAGSYHVRRDSIFFRDAAGGNAGTGVIQGDSIVIRGPLHTLTFRRRDPQ
jgi:hypothetical protein